ncbi:hypothetical protein THASP1DRAFT_21509 [Thamnocephalis sphaerospora]|uniref:Uncharacterized protein n=1 Tax=Thamnocephalis sphaerospora TaxID=78915 RepID=A0A4P9XX29_9FUNG|nr:hypothetical protein THASP1DRAFT_21509 [Thamnocephalis sphaerospora]|eukprot:RKP10847.1 hypothetical protein THASP1DRAFT_21509 [Thamnocephalis sphaerospora]
MLKRANPQVAGACQPAFALSFNGTRSHRLTALYHRCLLVRRCLVRAACLAADRIDLVYASMTDGEDTAGIMAFEDTPSPSEVDKIDTHEVLASLDRPVSPQAMPAEWKSLNADQMRNMLADAYGVIRERERELTLAAELGRDLELGKQARQRSIGRAGTPRRSPTPLRNGPHINIAGSPSFGALSETDEYVRPVSPMMPLAQPSGLMSMALGTPASRPFDPAAAAAAAVMGEERISGSDEDYGRRTPVRPTPRRAYGARTPSTGRHLQPHPQHMSDQEAIEELERKNAELEARLEQVQNEAEKARKASARRAKQAEKELASTRRELDTAYERIKELDDELTARKAIQVQSAAVGGGRRMRRTRTSGSVAFGGDQDGSGSEANSDLDVLDPKTLRRRVMELEASRDALAATKRIISERLTNAQQELKQVRQENSELRTRIRAHGQLEEEFEQQSAHLAQLERALEEQRRYARGDFSPSLAPVVHARSPDLTAEGLRRRGKNLMDEFERGRSLMDEFEMVLFRGPGDPNGDGEAEALGPSGVDTLFHALAGAARAGMDGETMGAGGFLLDDLVGAVGQATFGDNTALSKQDDSGFFSLLRGFLHAIWRWFRFLCVLWCAVVVSVYRGPPKVITSA